MNTTPTLKRTLAGLAMSGGVAVTLLALGAGTAQAAPACPAKGSACQRWCPGDPNPAGRPVPWDGNVCHDFYWDYKGVHDIGTGQFYAWNSMPF
ncbi:hypothetical protein [Mycobacterium sp.]|uniref:hypothetical protein n=1 Tax=Mycobacterium sp. TaxID=1785 RepID=UPI002BE92394|nr:hypothetical protein [Mycobacterium sp.]HTQ17841.1 hypothetical protein [Mycobacterium sp.]